MKTLAGVDIILDFDVKLTRTNINVSFFLLSVCFRYTSLGIQTQGCISE